MKRCIIGHLQTHQEEEEEAMYKKVERLDAIKCTIANLSRGGARERKQLSFKDPLPEMSKCYFGSSTPKMQSAQVTRADLAFALMSESPFS